MKIVRVELCDQYSQPSHISNLSISNTQDKDYAWSLSTIAQDINRDNQYHKSFVEIELVREGEDSSELLKDWNTSILQNICYHISEKNKAPRELLCIHCVKLRSYQTTITV